MVCNTYYVTDVKLGEASKSWKSWKFWFLKIHWQNLWERRTKALADEPATIEARILRCASQENNILVDIIHWISFSRWSACSNLTRNDDDDRHLANGRTFIHFLLVRRRRINLRRVRFNLLHNYSAAFVCFLSLFLCVREPLLIWTLKFAERHAGFFYHLSWLCWTVSIFAMIPDLIVRIVVTYDL